MRRIRLEFTIECRELRSESTKRLSYDARPRMANVLAASAEEAMNTFLRTSDATLVNVTRAHERGESIATVQHDDVVLLVRVYAA
jgi:hypothetical protein